MAMHAKHKMPGMMPKGPAKSSMPAKAAPKDQAPPTPALPVRQRYRLGGGC